MTLSAISRRLAASSFLRRPPTRPAARAAAMPAEVRSRIMARSNSAICGAPHIAEFERSMIQARVKAGLDRARAQGKQLGRPPVGDDVITAIRAELADGTGILKTARSLRVGTGLVHRIKREMIAAA
jgi:hypothetical protein